MCVGVQRTIWCTQSCSSLENKFHKKSTLIEFKNLLVDNVHRAMHRFIWCWCISETIPFRPTVFHFRLWLAFGICTSSLLLLLLSRCGKREQKKNWSHEMCAFVSFVSIVMSSSTSIPFEQNSYCNLQWIQPNTMAKKFHFQFQIYLTPISILRS